MDRIAIEIKKLSIDNCVNELDFQIHAGKIIGILSDKDVIKTFFNVLCGIKKIDSGKITYFDHNIKKERNYLLNFVGIMPDELPAFKNKTVKNYFFYSSKFYQGDFFENAVKYVRYFNLDFDRKINTLTLEQKRIISFIDSIFFEPEILILNSPFKDVSSPIMHKMANILFEFKQKGYCVVIGQDSFDCMAICDKNYIIKNQDLEEYKDFKKKRAYKKIYLELENESDINVISSLNTFNTYQTGLQISFICKDKISDILKVLNKINVSDLIIEDPSLDELENDI